MVKLRDIAQDYPERCESTCLTKASKNGNRHNRWGVSSKWSEEKTPSCEKCDTKRVIEILANKHHNPLEKCEHCLDWQRVIVNHDTLPVNLEHIESTNAEPVDLPPFSISFKMITKSLSMLQDDLRERMRNRSKCPTIKTLKELFSVMNILGTHQGEFAKQIRKGLLADKEKFDITKCSLYPWVISVFAESGIDIDHFQPAPMHLLFLGILKSLIAELPRIFNRLDKAENQAWHDLVTDMKDFLSLLNSLSVDWCDVRLFSGDSSSSVGVAGWTSKHCVALSRLILHCFASTDGLLARDEISEDTKIGMKLYRKMLLSFLLLLSHSFDPDYVSSCERDEKIEHYVRLFLSSCRNFDLKIRNNMQKIKELQKQRRIEKNAQKQRQEVRKAAKINPKAKKQQKTGTRDAKGKADKNKQKSKIGAVKVKIKCVEHTDDSDDDGDDKVPFYLSKPNFQGLLGLGMMVQTFGSIANMWEGNNEGYIRYLKREMGVMMNNDEFLSKVLIKTARARFFDDILSENSFLSTSYQRNYNVTIYRSLSDIIEKKKLGDPISGMVDKFDNLFVCYRGSENTVCTRQLDFTESVGRKRFTIWYSTFELSKTESRYNDSKDFVSHCHDYFIGVSDRGSDDAKMFSIVCRSWRMRCETGSLSKPISDKSILLLV